MQDLTQCRGAEKINLKDPKKIIIIAEKTSKEKFPQKIPVTGVTFNINCDTNKINEQRSPI